MTRSTQNVSTAAQSQSGRQGSHLLVSGRNGAHTGWPAPEDTLLPGRVKQFRTGALADNREVFNEQGEAQQRKLFPSYVAPPADDPQVARVLLSKVRLERTGQFGSCFLGLELWKRLELDRFFERNIDQEPADVPWSRVAALLAINRLCAPG